VLSQEETAATHPGHQVEITVNTKPVSIEGPKATGLQIKEAAIAQGVQIGLDFILYQELGGGRTKPVGDGDTVTVHQGLAFTAIANDDNS
jgi:Multiubiquitin